MKLILAISLLFLSTLIIGVSLDIIDIDAYTFSLVDYPGDGNSEPDSSESSEFDFEEDCVKLLDFTVWTTEQKLPLRLTTQFFTGTFTEVFDPPPEDASC